jgi:hypothetical protein
MPKIVTTSELQKNIGQLLRWLGRANVIVTNRGKATAVVLPYFEESDDLIADYMEEYEMRRNLPALRKQWQESLDSGLSDLVI